MNKLLKNIHMFDDNNIISIFKYGKFIDKFGSLTIKFH